MPEKIAHCLSFSLNISDNEKAKFLAQAQELTNMLVAGGMAEKDAVQKVSSLWNNSHLDGYSDGYSEANSEYRD